MGIIGMIVIGFIVGLVARAILPGTQALGFILTTVLGIIGSFVAGYVGQLMGLYQAGEGAGFLGSVIGAMILLSDGADNTGGVDLETLSEIRRQRIPVHTIGLGRETMARDVEISNVDVAMRALPASSLARTVRFHQHGHPGQQGRLTQAEGSDGSPTIVPSNPIAWAKDSRMGGWYQ